MKTLNVNRKPPKITSNVPETMFGVKFNLRSECSFGIAPPIKNNEYMAGITLEFIIVDFNSDKELSKLSTENIFSFKATMPENEAVNIIYQFYLVCVDEINLEIKNSKSALFFGKQFDNSPDYLIRDKIVACLRLNSVN